MYLIIISTNRFLFMSLGSFLNINIFFATTTSIIILMGLFLWPRMFCCSVQTLLSQRESFFESFKFGTIL